MEAFANIEAEEAVLGAVLLDGGAIDKLDMLSSRDFTVYQNGVVFDIFRYLNKQNTPIDLVTTIQLLQDEKKYPNFDIGRLTDLLEATPTAANIVSYAKIVKDASRKRTLSALITDLQKAIDDPKLKSEDAVKATQDALFALEGSDNDSGIHSIGVVLQEAFETVEQLSRSDDHLIGISTGFSELDRILLGLCDTDLIVIAARPGMGKTALALKLAENAAAAGHTTAIFSQEMGREQLAQRYLADVSRTPLKHIRTGKIQDENWGAMTDAVGKHYNNPLYIDDTPYQPVSLIGAKCRRLKRDKGLELVVIDYLQLMQGDKIRNGNREQEISSMTRQLKALAKELKIPVVILSQLSRNLESRQDKKPLLSDLRESGAIEQDADVVMFVYREEVYNNCACPEMGGCVCGRRGKAEIIVEKQRNGPIGTATLKFEKDFTRFANAEKSY